MAKINIDGIEYEAECQWRRFNPKYEELTHDEAQTITGIKLAAEGLALLIDMTRNRESSIAMTHLETAVMWAVKGVVAAYDGNPEDAQFFG